MLTREQRIVIAYQKLNSINVVSDCFRLDPKYVREILKKAGVTIPERGAKFHIKKATHISKSG